MNANIAIFVPHNGCPNMCSFCNQFSITSHIYQPDVKDIDDAVKIAVNSMGDNCKDSEIAFFGGSFTAIDRTYMVDLLKSASKYVFDGTAKGIRISTRPDAIDGDVLGILKQYGVTTIELGAQSMDDSVLTVNKRGHTSADVVNASKLIKDFGFQLGLQMMTGLYGDTDEGAIDTCRKFIELSPDCVRIYPTIVLRGTLLADHYEQGIYQPQTVESAVELCAVLLKMFNEADIPVIRLGLHTINEDDYVAGPWHPSFGELCQGQLTYLLLKEIIDKPGNYTVFVHPSMISKTVGHKKINVKKFEDMGIHVSVRPDPQLPRDRFIVKEVSDS